MRVVVFHREGHTGMFEGGQRGSQVRFGGREAGDPRFRNERPYEAGTEILRDRKVAEQAIGTGSPTADLQSEARFERFPTQATQIVGHQHFQGQVIAELHEGCTRLAGCSEEAECVERPLWRRIPGHADGPREGIGTETETHGHIFAFFRKI